MAAASIINNNNDHLYCTFAVTGPHKALQDIFVCRSCSSNDEASSLACCVCQACAETCHAQHDVAYVGVGMSYCDCSSSFKCCRLETKSKKKAQELGVEETNGIVGHDVSLPEKEYVQEVFQMPVLENINDTDRLVEQACELIKHTKDTHWISVKDLELEGNQWCELERLAYFVYRRHVKHYKLDENLGGAEWWVQVKQASNPDNDTSENSQEAVDLHYDKDEELAANFGLGSFPTLSTVTYLTCPPSAAPTIVFPRTYHQDDDEDHVMDGMLVSHAVRGKHLVFDGRLLHGAPAHPLLRRRTNDKSRDELRVTFLVNIWARKPLGVQALSMETRRHVMEAVGGEFAPNQDLSWASEGLAFHRRCIEVVEMKEENMLETDKRIELPFVSSGATWVDDDDDENDGLVVVTFPPLPHKTDTVRFQFGPGIQAYLDYKMDENQADNEEDEVDEDSGPSEFYV